MSLIFSKPGSCTVHFGKPLFRSVASEGPSRNTSDLTEGEWARVPKEPRFTGSHSTTLCRFLVRFIRFTLGVSVVHLLTQGRSRARRKKVSILSHATSSGCHGTTRVVISICLQRPSLGVQLTFLRKHFRSITLCE